MCEHSFSPPLSYQRQRCGSSAEGGGTPKFTRDVVLAVASALLSLHQLGVIHTDVKPDNIILAPAGAPCPGGELNQEVRLCDFGRALALDAEAPGRRRSKKNVFFQGPATHDS